jgi:hypothetical protein
MIAGSIEAYSQVGSKDRWPYTSAHPDCWVPPHRGTVLCLDDPAAWSNTVAFPYQSPNQEKCTQHVEECISNGLLLDRVPVLWTWANGNHTWVAWELASELISYEENLKLWEQARKDAYAKCIKSGA